MIRTNFVALGGFALAVVCSAGLGIASGVEDSDPAELCNSHEGEDTSKWRVHVAGSDGEPLRDAHGKPHTVPMCPPPPLGPPGSNAEYGAANCKVETNSRGQRGESCDDVDCGFDVNAQGELLEVCEGPSKRQRD